MLNFQCAFLGDSKYKVVEREAHSLYGGMGAAVRKGEVSERYVPFLARQAGHVGARLRRRERADDGECRNEAHA